MTQVSNETVERITEHIKAIMQVALDEVEEPEGMLPAEKALSWYSIVVRAASSMIDSASDMLIELSE